MAQRGCVNSADKFCYVCGEFVTNKSFNKITQVIKDKYREHFGIGISHQDKSWAPHGVCGVIDTYTKRHLKMCTRSDLCNQCIGWSLKITKQTAISV